MELFYRRISDTLRYECSTESCCGKRYYTINIVVCDRGGPRSICDKCLQGMELKTPRQQIYYTVTYPTCTVEIYTSKCRPIHCDDIYRQYQLSKI